MMKFYRIVICLIGFVSAAVGSNPAMPACVSDYASTNNSYTMSPGEQLLTFSNSIPGGYVYINGIQKQMKLSQNIMMSVPVNPTPESLDDLQYMQIHSDPVPEIPLAVIEKMNSLLQQTNTGQGSTIYLYYTLTPDVEGNYYTCSVTVTAVGNGQSLQLFVSSNAPILTRTFKEFGKTYPYPSQQQMEQKPYTVPAMPQSIPIVFTTNQQTTGIKQGEICFGSSPISVNQQEQFYLAQFTFKPAPFVQPIKSVDNVTTIVQSVLAQTQKMSVAIQATNIASALTSALYTSSNDWETYICPALTRLQISVALGKAIVNSMNIVGASYPCAAQAKVSNRLNRREAVNKIKRGNK